MLLHLVKLPGGRNNEPAYINPEYIVKIEPTRLCLLGGEVELEEGMAEKLIERLKELQSLRLIELK